MKWIKASERLPENLKPVKVKIDGKELDSEWVEYESAFMVDGYRYPPRLYYIEWLDESPSLSAEKEAEAYKIINEDGSVNVYDFSGMTDKEKEDFINGFLELTSKHILSVFTGCGLKTHIIANVLEKETNQEYTFSFTKKNLYGHSLGSGGDGWVSVDVPTEYDGYYQCVIEEKQECGAVHRFQQVTYNEGMKWRLPSGQAVTHYRNVYTYPLIDNPNLITK